MATLSPPKRTGMDKNRQGPKLPPFLSLHAQLPLPLDIFPTGGEESVRTTLALRSDEPGLGPSSDSH